MASGRDLVAGELSVGGRLRGLTMRLPRSVEGGSPLVLVLHGNHPDAGGWIMRDRTTFGKLADAGGFAVAYPDGYGGCWADGRGVTTADEAGVDDVAFLRAVIDWSAERHGTWPDRTVVAGISNGAFMAHRLGLEASDQVAVLAAVAGGLPAEFSSRNTSGSGVGGTRVVSWTVFGGGHAWPGTPAAPGPADQSTQEFDAAEEICRFAEPLLASADSRRL